MAGLPAVPAIFLISIMCTVALVFGATVIGRYLALLLPSRLRPTARFYLAPALGLAFLTVAASLVGRWLPLGNGFVAAKLTLVPLVWAWLHEPFKRRALAHALSNGLFALAAGVTILVPLLVYGAFNAHNDAFTYLAHSSWLQDHAFSETIAPSPVTPLTTQIAMYQHFGFRMGGSFLLALLQSAFGLQWAYFAYPAIIIGAVFSTCLSLGFPIARNLGRFGRSVRLLLLCFPAFGFGGLGFAADYGFLPQTLGMTFACSLLFLLGPIVKWQTSHERLCMAASLKAGMLSALLLSAMTFAYSEFVPFVGLALVIVALLTMVQTGKLLPLIVYGLVVFLFSLILLNVEILRSYSALKLQSGAVVGTPIDWTLLGFVAHALGVHGGAWDTFQWTTPSANWGSYAGGSVSVLILGVLLGISAPKMLGAARTAALLPVTTMLVILSIGLLYFRYGVASPFPVGVGQSWSQFKLADWAHPFLSVFLLLALLLSLSRLDVRAGKVVTVAAVIGLIGAAALAVERVRPVAKSYGNVRDVAQFYLDFREAVLTSCAPEAPVYLALADRDLKFRRMALLYLPDNQIFSDWEGDDSIPAWLPEDQRRMKLAAGQCIVERRSSEQVVRNGLDVGPFTVGLMVEEGGIRVGSVEGAHAQEANGEDWWRWIEREAIFELQPLLVPDNAHRTRVTFTYETRGPQTITLGLEAGGQHDARHLASVTIKSSGTAPAVFDQLLDVRPSDIRRLRVTTDGVASPLQAPDPRSAAWRIQNLRLEPNL